MAITITPEEPRATIDACNIAVADAPDERGPDDTGGSFEYYLEATSPDWDGKPLRSHVFNASHDEEHVWPSLIFPVAGTWTIALVDTADENSDQTLEVEVV